MTEYNGWTNYETWVVKLWIDNEQSTQEFWADKAKETIVFCSPYPATDKVVTILAAELKDHHEEAIYVAPRVHRGFAADLLNAALSDVNWHEIATSLIDDQDDDHPDTVTGELT